MVTPMVAEERDYAVKVDKVGRVLELLIESGETPADIWAFVDEYPALAPYVAAWLPRPSPSSSAPPSESL